MAGWMNRLLAALGLGGRKAEADVSQDPVQRGPRRYDTTTGEASQEHAPPPRGDTADAG
jgi:hypothetical protein